MTFESFCRVPGFRSFFFLVLFFSFPGFGYSQDMPVRKRIVVVEEDGTKTTPSSAMKKQALVIKAGFSRVLRGELPLLAEYMINKNIAVEAGPSLTYSDYLGKLWFTNYEPLVKDDYLYPFNGNALMGYGFGSAFKYFPNPDDALTGNSIGMYFNYRGHKYHMVYENFQMNPARMNVTEFGLVFCIEDNDDFYYETLLGIGVRSYKYDYVTQEVHNFGAPTYTAYKGKFVIPTVFFQYRLGLDIFN